MQALIAQIINTAMRIGWDAQEVDGHIVFIWQWGEEEGQDYRIIAAANKHIFEDSRNARLNYHNVEYADKLREEWSKKTGSQSTIFYRNRLASCVAFEIYAALDLLVCMLDRIKLEHEDDLKG